tara:strand:+ start:252878 stop:253297 length:420 start_codon:yes stop_codon:yes gene_type:complete
MNTMPLFKLSVAFSFIFAIAAVQAVPMPPVPLEPIYFEPPVELATDEIYQQSCVQLDNAIRYLQPYRYTYKPEFHEDGANQVATALIVFDSVPIVHGLLGLAYLGYSGLVEEKEQRRMLEVEQKIAMYQQVKSEKHCFE